MTAKKVRIVDLVNGEWVQQDGMEPSYVIAKTGERVSRARILATIVSKFLSDDGNFGSLTIDDETDTMRAKCFKDMSILDGVETGQLVDIIGKVREYNGEIYLMPEVIRQVEDPNFLLLRKLEIMKCIKDIEKSGVSEGTEARNEDRKGVGVVGSSGEAEKNDLRKKLIEIIEASENGIEYSKLIEQSGQPEEKVEPVVNDLLSEGICYEPTPGKIKKI